MLAFLLMAGVAYGANMADFRRSDDIEDRRAESSQGSYSDSLSKLELSRKNLIAIAKAAKDPNGHLNERCPNLKSVAPDLAAIGKAAEEAGPVTNVLPADGGTRIAGIFTAADLAGVDPCTGAVKAETGMLGKGADLLTLKKKAFGERFAPVMLKVSFGSAHLAKAGAGAAADCQQWSRAVMGHMEKFRAGYEAISDQLYYSREDLLYQAQQVSGKACKK